MSGKLRTIHRLSGRMVVKTGLHIGAGNDVIEIGGLDNPVLKDQNGLPYVPGSSLKGKLRSIMEWSNKDGYVSDKPCACGKCQVCRIFGPHDAKKTEEMRMGPPRLIVRDAHLNEVSRSAVSLTEAKYENTIGRMTGTAGNPRQLERVHAGMVFDFEIIYRNFTQEENVANDDMEALKKGLKLLEYDYLGGSGSRGSGKVSFEFIGGGWENVSI